MCLKPVAIHSTQPGLDAVKTEFISLLVGGRKSEDDVWKFFYRAGGPSHQTGVVRLGASSFAC